MKRLTDNTAKTILQVAGTAFLAAIFLAACATVEENIAKTKAAYYTPGKEVHLTDMKGEYRFCEVGLITGTSKANAVINIWNSTGSGDCSPEQFAALDAEKMKDEFDVQKIWLNPSRHWTFDEFWAYEIGVEKTFGDVKALWMVVISDRIK